ncbi:ceramide-1-phosphate transfer protein-like [Betta splendens]|uniref:Ceramide-1-phosphate transfer protein-like n=1 Tax=Betta splendens TaxID=158456 RepID=A0A6P7LY92_BETSP|nr:ceramide-1-phosphate transfer protein-like [Betta splendens]
MVLVRRTPLLRYLLLAAMLALLLLISSFWLPHGGGPDCGAAWPPCLSLYHTPRPPRVREAAPVLKECPGQRFQTWRLLLSLESSLSDDDDVLLEPYLQSWDQLLVFMESLGAVVRFFSQKVEEKILLMRQLSLSHGAEAPWKPLSGAYRSVGSMVEAELGAGMVDFSRRSDSGCRTLLRLHRSLLWLKLMLEGLAEGPDAAGRFKTPGELGRQAYQQALAPHHPWMLRRAAELLFVALPERGFFLRLVCVEQQEAEPVLRVLVQALTRVHARTQRILARRGLLELP